MEDLRPSQLILLSILVTFVTSIATTVVSLSLLSDTPLSITQVVNRVVQEQAIPDDQLELLRSEILEAVDERLSDMPTPEVAGVQDVGAEFLLDLITTVSRPDDLGRLWLNKTAYLSSGVSTEEAGFDMIPVGDMVLAIAEGANQVSVGEQREQLGDFYVVHPTLGIVTPTQAFTPYDEVAEGWSLTLTAVEACQRPGAWVIAADGTLQAACVSNGLALLGAQATSSEVLLDHNEPQENEATLE